MTAFLTNQLAYRRETNNYLLFLFRFRLSPNRLLAKTMRTMKQHERELPERNVWVLDGFFDKFVYVLGCIWLALFGIGFFVGFFSGLVE